MENARDKCHEVKERKSKNTIELEQGHGRLRFSSLQSLCGPLLRFMAEVLLMQAGILHETRSDVRA